MLPFQSSETDAAATVHVRHKVAWNRKTGAVEWKQLEAETQGPTKLLIRPGSYDPTSRKDTPIDWELVVLDGKVVGRYTPRKDGTYRLELTADLSPRDIIWKQPAFTLAGFGIKGGLVADSRHTTGSLRSLERLDIQELSIAGIEAGIYRAAGIKGRGLWTTPQWKVENLEGDVFGGHLSGHGRGDWPVEGPRRVSVRLRGDGIDLHELLESFNSPYARDVEARLGGTLAVDATGREWRAMEFDLHGEPGTVRLSRTLLYDILAPSFGGALEKKQVEEVLDSTFGRSTEMIPFDEMQVAGGLEGDVLGLKLPLHNRALKLDVEPRIEEALLWKTWDWLVEQGLDSTSGASVKEGRIEREDGSGK